MDNSDAKELAHKADKVKTAELANLRELIQKAELAAKSDKVTHNKFDGFLYYAVSISFEGENYDILLNVGHSKYDGKYHIYDITKNNIEKRRTANQSSTGLSRPVGNAIKNSSSTDSISQTSRKINTSSKKSFTFKEIDGYARENIEDYKSLSASNQAIIRSVIRQGLALGMHEAEVFTYAKVAAHSGVNIVFDKQRTVVGRKKGTTELVYADGFYDHARREIVVNPEGKRSTEALLIHELAHAIYKDKQGRVIAERGVKKLTEEQRQAITKKYAGIKEGNAVTIIGEFNAHYAEGILGNKNTLEQLFRDGPTLKDRILDFFKGAKTDYASDEKLSREARKLFKHYKKLFDAFSEQNRGNNMVERSAGIGKVSYALDYSRAIDQLDNNTLDTQQNTHLKLLDHTPKIYTDKAGAINREIVMGWDIAYFAMKKNGDIPGNYHGLGIEVMKALPRALEDPLYIVKQKNGRIAAVTEIVVKGKRAVFASIELEAFQTTVQEGESEAKIYNLVVTITDAKPNYLQNTIFGGKVVYNKNNEDPAHFILRLKSLEKALPTYDPARSSIDSIHETEEKSNSFAEINSEISSEVLSVLSEKQAEALVRRGVKGDALLNATDLASEILAVEGEITDDAKAVVYHGTTPENAKKIIETGKMYGKEDALFFSTKKDGIVLDYGKAVIKARIPLEKLELNDIFDSEIHLTMKVKPHTLTNISFALPEDFDGEVSVEASADLQQNTKLAPKSDLNHERAKVKTEKYARVATKSSGQIAKERANFQGEKVFDKSSVSAAMSTIDVWSRLPVKVRDELTERLWQGFNQRRDNQGYVSFRETMYGKLRATLRQELEFSLSKDESALMDKQLAAALGNQWLILLITKTRTPS